MWAQVLKNWPAAVDGSSVAVDGTARIVDEQWKTCALASHAGHLRDQLRERSF
jgi:hypothetical protein